MKCIRCGREAEEDQVFCEECRQDMARHPVNPSTPIQLPVKKKRVQVKRNGFKMAAKKWEDRAFKMKSTIAYLVFLVILLVAALVLCLCMMAGVTPEWLNEIFGYAFS